MGALGKLIDVALFVFFALMAVVAPLIDGQTSLPGGIYPAFLTDLKSKYIADFGDYLLLEKPHFLVGLVWHELLFLWPLSIANVYAILAGKPWFGTTCLLYGASVVTSMAAILGEMIGSGKASERLLMMYVPFLGSWDSGRSSWFSFSIHQKHWICWQEIYYHAQKKAGLR